MNNDEFYEYEHQHPQWAGLSLNQNKGKPSAKYSMPSQERQTNGFTQRPLVLGMQIPNGYTQTIAQQFNIQSHGSQSYYGLPNTVQLGLGSRKPSKEYYQREPKSGTISREDSKMTSTGNIHDQNYYSGVLPQSFPFAKSSSFNNQNIEESPTRLYDNEIMRGRNMERKSDSISRSKAPYYGPHSVTINSTTKQNETDLFFSKKLDAENVVVQSSSTSSPLMSELAVNYANLHRGALSHSTSEAAIASTSTKNSDANVSIPRVKPPSPQVKVFNRDNDGQFSTVIYPSPGDMTIVQKYGKSNDITKVGVNQGNLLNVKGNADAYHHSKVDNSNHEKVNDSFVGKGKNRHDMYVKPKMDNLASGAFKNMVQPHEPTGQLANENVFNLSGSELERNQIGNNLTGKIVYDDEDDDDDENFVSDSISGSTRTKEARRSNKRSNKFIPSFGKNSSISKSSYSANSKYRSDGTNSKFNILTNSIGRGIVVVGRRKKRSKNMPPLPYVFANSNLTEQKPQVSTSKNVTQEIDFSTVNSTMKVLVANEVDKNLPNFSDFPTSPVGSTGTSSSIRREVFGGVVNETPIFKEEGNSIFTPTFDETMPGSLDYSPLDMKTSQTEAFYTEQILQGMEDNAANRPAYFDGNNYNNNRFECADKYFSHGSSDFESSNRHYRKRSGSSSTISRIGGDEKNSLGSRKGSFTTGSYPGPNLPITMKDVVGTEHEDLLKLNGENEGFVSSSYQTASKSPDVLETSFDYQNSRNTDRLSNINLDSVVRLGEKSLHEILYYGFENTSHIKKIFTQKYPQPQKIIPDEKRLIGRKTVYGSVGLYSLGNSRKFKSEEFAEYYQTNDQEHNFDTSFTSKYGAEEYGPKMVTKRILRNNERPSTQYSRGSRILPEKRPINIIKEKIEDVNHADKISSHVVETFIVGSHKSEDSVTHSNDESETHLVGSSKETLNGNSDTVPEVNKLKILQEATQLDDTKTETYRLESFVIPGTARKESLVPKEDSDTVKVEDDKKNFSLHEAIKNIDTNVITLPLLGKYSERHEQGPIQIETEPGGKITLDREDKVPNGGTNGEFKPIEQRPILSPTNTFSKKVYRESSTIISDSMSHSIADVFTKMGETTNPTSRRISSSKSNMEKVMEDPQVDDGKLEDRFESIIKGKEPLIVEHADDSGNDTPVYNQRLQSLAISDKAQKSNEGKATGGGPSHLTILLPTSINKDGSKDKKSDADAITPSKFKFVMPQSSSATDKSGSANNLLSGHQTLPRIQSLENLAKQGLNSEDTKNEQASSSSSSSSEVELEEQNDKMNIESSSHINEQVSITTTAPGMTSSVREFDACLDTVRESVGKGFMETLKGSSPTMLFQGESLEDELHARVAVEEDMMRLIFSGTQMDQTGNKVKDIDVRNSEHSAVNTVKSQTEKELPPSVASIQKNRESSLLSNIKRRLSASILFPHGQCHNSESSRAENEESRSLASAMMGTIHGEASNSKFSTAEKEYATDASATESSTTANLRKRRSFLSRIPGLIGLAASNPSSVYKYKLEAQSYKADNVVDRDIKIARRETMQDEAKEMSDRVAEFLNDSPVKGKSIENANSHSERNSAEHEINDLVLEKSQGKDIEQDGKTAKSEIEAAETVPIEPIDKYERVKVSENPLLSFVKEVLEFEQDNEEVEVERQDKGNGISIAAIIQPNDANALPSKDSTTVATKQVAPKPIRTVTVSSKDKNSTIVEDFKFAISLVGNMLHVSEKFGISNVQILSPFWSTGPAVVFFTVTSILVTISQMDQFKDNEIGKAFKKFQSTSYGIVTNVLRYTKQYLNVTKGWDETACPHQQTDGTGKQSLSKKTCIVCQERYEILRGQSHNMVRLLQVYRDVLENKEDCKDSLKCLASMLALESKKRTGMDGKLYPTISALTSSELANGYPWEMLSEIFATQESRKEQVEEVTAEANPMDELLKNIVGSINKASLIQPDKNEGTDKQILTDAIQGVKVHPYSKHTEVNSEEEEELPPTPPSKDSSMLERIAVEKDRVFHFDTANIKEYKEHTCRDPDSCEINIMNHAMDVLKVAEKDTEESNTKTLKLSKYLKWISLKILDPMAFNSIRFGVHSCARIVSLHYDIQEFRGSNPEQTVDDISRMNERLYEQLEKVKKTLLAVTDVARDKDRKYAPSMLGSHAEFIIGVIDAIISTNSEYIEDISDFLLSQKQQSIDESDEELNADSENENSVLDEIFRCRKNEMDALVGSAIDMIKEFSKSVTVESQEIYNFALKTNCILDTMEDFIKRDTAGTQILSLAMETIRNVEYTVYQISRLEDIFKSTENISNEEKNDYFELSLIMSQRLIAAADTLNAISTMTNHLCEMENSAEYKNKYEATKRRNSKDVPAVIDKLQDSTIRVGLGIRSINDISNLLETDESHSGNIERNRSDLRSKYIKLDTEYGSFKNFKRRVKQLPPTPMEERSKFNKTLYQFGQSFFLLKEKQQRDKRAGHRSRRHLSNKAHIWKAVHGKSYPLSVFMIHFLSPTVLEEALNDAQKSDIDLVSSKKIVSFQEGTNVDSGNKTDFASRRKSIRFLEALQNAGRLTTSSSLNSSKGSEKHVTRILYDRARSKRGKSRSKHSRYHKAGGVSIRVLNEPDGITRHASIVEASLNKLNGNSTSGQSGIGWFANAIRNVDKDTILECAQSRIKTSEPTSNKLIEEKTTTKELSQISRSEGSNPVPVPPPRGHSLVNTGKKLPEIKDKHQEIGVLQWSDVSSEDLDGWIGIEVHMKRIPIKVVVFNGPVSRGVSVTSHRSEWYQNDDTNNETFEYDSDLMTDYNMTELDINANFGNDAKRRHSAMIKDRKTIYRRDLSVNVRILCNSETGKLVLAGIDIQEDLYSTPLTDASGKIRRQKYSKWYTKSCGDGKPDALLLDLLDDKQAAQVMSNLGMKVADAATKMVESINVMF